MRLVADSTVAMINSLSNESHKSRNQHYERRFCPRDDVYVASSRISKWKISTICQYPLNLGYKSTTKVYISVRAAWDHTEESIERFHAKTLNDYRNSLPPTTNWCKRPWGIVSRHFFVEWRCRRLTGRTIQVKVEKLFWRGCAQVLYRTWVGLKQIQQLELIRGWSIDQLIFLGWSLETSIERGSDGEGPVQHSRKQRDRWCSP
jgi:hypothetical protein